MNGGKQLARWAVLGIVDGMAVAALRPDWPQLVGDLTAPHRWLDRVGADQAALTLTLAAAWCVAVWLAIGLVAIGAAALPGQVGQLSRQVASRVLPAVVLRAVAGVAGFGVLVAPVAPLVAGAGTAASAATAASASASARLDPAPTWPTDGPGSVPHLGWPTTPGAVDWPTTPGAPPVSAGPPGAPPVSAGPSGPGPDRPHPSVPSTPRPHLPLPSPPAEPQTTADQPVRVRPGDSLWLITAHRLGADASDADIAAEWPRWYAANRAVIGDDPSLIQPGQVLQAPPVSG